MASTGEEYFSTWLSISIIGLIAFLISGYILKQELHKRRSEQATLHSTCLNVWSLSTLILGVLIGFFMMVLYIPGLCHVSVYVQTVTSLIQPVLMGFYQITRLYQINQIHDAHSPFTWSLITLFGIGFVIFINMLIVPVFVTGYINKTCGINFKSSLKYYYSSYSFSSSQIFPDWFRYTVMLYVCWDILTLMLYIIKLRNLSKATSNKKDGYKIKSVVNKIVILTVSYQINLLFTFSISTIFTLRNKPWSNDLFGLISIIVYGIAILSPSVFYCLSMYLMLDHNHKEYRKYLKILKWLKLYYFCYCCWDERITNDDFEHEESAVEITTNTTTKTEDLYPEINTAGGIPDELTNHGTDRTDSVVF